MMGRMLWKLVRWFWRFLKVFTKRWARRPSWSCDLDQVADKGRAIRYNISSALPLHDEGMMTGAFLSCTLDPNLLLE